MLEADTYIPEVFRIYQIFYYLPLKVRDKLERDKIKIVENLIQELKKANDSFVIKNVIFI